MKILKKFSPLLLLFITQCSCSNTQKVIIEKPENKIEKQYVKGTMVFDSRNNASRPDSITHPQLGNIFEKQENGFHFDHPYSLSQLEYITNNLYFADVNCDGYDEICYTTNFYGSDKSNITSVIYDYKNHDILYSFSYVYRSTNNRGCDMFVLENDEFVMWHVIYDNYGRPGTYAKELIDKKTKFLVNSEKKLISEEFDLPLNILDASMSFCKQQKSSNYERYSLDFSTSISIEDFDYYLDVLYIYDGKFSLSQIQPKFYSDDNVQIYYHEGPIETYPYARVIYNIVFPTSGTYKVTIKVNGIEKDTTFTVTE